MIQLSHVTKFPSRRIYKGFEDKGEALLFAEIFNGNVLKGIQNNYLVLL